MIRVVVVDDEAFLRKSIKNTIEMDHRFKVVGEAGDGMNALEIIGQLKPDVVFLDMRMPILDGIGLLKELHNRTYTPVSIVLSGYSDFEYARSALHYHAFDYLLKPIDRNVLSLLLQRIYEKVTVSSYNTKRELFERVVYGRCNSFTEDQTSQILGFSKYLYAFYVCYGCYLPNTYRHLPPIFDKKDDASIFEEITSLCTDQEQAWFFRGNHSAEHLVIVASSDSALDSKKIPTLLFQTREAEIPSVTVIYGDVLRTLKDLQNSVIEVKYSHMLNSAFGISSIQRCNTVSGCSAESIGFSTEFQKVLALNLENRDFDSFYKHISFILASCENKKCSQSILLYILKKICETANRNEKNRLYEDQIEELFYNSMYYPELKKAFELLLREMLQPSSVEPVASVVEEIYVYIDTHFADILTLKSLSEKFLISTSYLCSLFKKEYNISPIEYIIEKRIQTSQMLLLQDNTTTVKEIAEKVGYQDAYYFSRLFKTYTGKTPSQFREFSRKKPPD